ncbi:sporulation inhibitor of replication protein SirA [Evansella sp. AB-rgal1]|uniref:sporulation inhibitor of replication protein SirA n=1 Tax=Evansella sp. AB-rgal1 TaxID=3242696 RepID=UPI00359E49FA
MREYEIYIIKDEIAIEYFGLEGKLFNLFQENRFAKGKLKDVTDKQINFIVEPINIAKLEDIIVSRLQKSVGYSADSNKHFIRLPDKNSQAGLYLDDNYLTLFSEGTYDAEACFFEILRYYHSYFIAMEFEQQRYGWLKPLKSIDYVQQIN